MHSVHRLLFCTILATIVAPIASAQDFNVTFLHTPSVRALKGRDLIITGNMVGADQVSIAALAYRIKGTKDFKIRELKLIKGDLYKGKIPGRFIKPPAVEYYCYAVDFEGERHTVYASKKAPEAIPVVEFNQRSKHPNNKAAKRIQAKTGIQRTSTKKKEVRGPVVERKRPRVVLPTGDSQLLDRTPALASVVSRSQIFSMGARTVADILDQLPGISISRSVSGEFNLTMRGVQSEPEVLVLVDGHRINDLFSGVSLLEFPADAIERIEVVRGPNVSLSIPGTFMGVVNIITQKDASPHASVSYGRFKHVRASVGGGWSSDNAEVGGQVQFMTSDGQDRMVTQDVLTGVLGTSQTSGDFISNTPGHVDDHRMQLHAQLQGVLKDFGGGALELVTHYFFQERGAYVGKWDSLDKGSDLGVHVFNADLSYVTSLGSMVSLDAKAYFDTHLVDSGFQTIRAPDDPSGNSYKAGDIVLKGGLREIERYQTLTTGGQLGTTLELTDTNHLSIGSQFEYLSLPEFKQIRDTSGVACVPCDASTEGCLIIQGFELPCGELNALASGKDRMDIGFFIQDYWRDLFLGFDALAGIRLDYYTDSGLTFTPRAALVYSPLAQLRIKLMYSHAFRAPTFRELYDSPRFDPIRSFQGDEGLEPVEVNTLEFGLDGRTELSGLDVELKANFFVNWIENSIESVDTGAGSTSWGNAESLFVMGTEVEGLTRFGQRSRVFVNSSWMRAEIQVAGQPDSSYITDVPQLRFNFGMDLEVLDFLNLHLGLRYGSERRNNIRHKLELLRPMTIPAYTLIRVGVSTEPILLDHLVLFAHAYNVFDYDYTDPPPRADHLPGYLPRAPFAFMAGIAWRP